MSQHPGREEWRWYTEKLRPQHVERLAVVYVRQSTMQQVLEHQESTRLQYGLVQRAVAWGWSEARVLVIDDDLVLQRGFEIWCHAAHQPCMEGGQHDGPDRDHAQDGLGDPRY